MLAKVLLASSKTKAIYRDLPKRYLSDTNINNSFGINVIKILYVEDDVMIGKTSFHLLQHENFLVDWAKTGNEALEFLFNKLYHIVLLDLGLPELDGLEILKHIRKTADLTNMSVIIISARDQSKDKILGLKCGADDYIVKPYDFDELIARIESVLRRGKFNHSIEDVCFSAKDVSLFPQSQRVTKNKIEVDLSPKEWAILELNRTG
ncbi:response regulator transcription factor, partial [Acinetobacter nosocomialis]